MKKIKPPARQNEEDGVRVDFLWKVHSYTNDYIRFADSKAGFVAASVVTLIGTLVAAHAFDHVGWIAPSSWPVHTWIGFLALGLLVVSFLCALLAIRPRLHSTVPKGFIFWTSVAEHANDLAYAEECSKLTAHEIELNVSRHVYTLAGICKRKYFWTNLAMLIGSAGGALAGGVLLTAHIWSK